MGLLASLDGPGGVTLMAREVSDEDERVDKRDRILPILRLGPAQLPADLETLPIEVVAAFDLAEINMLFCQVLEVIGQEEPVLFQSARDGDGAILLGDRLLDRRDG